MGYAHLDLDTEHTLPQQNVPDSVINEFTRRLTGMNHEAIGELHGLGTRRTKLARNNYFTALGPRLHDEA